ncbi:hypothetical protein A3206_01635 [Candidatus Methanomassiliicoccus intestinalis]|jgi:CRISPR-associated protein cas5|uniref:CRISPR-associated protein Cas5 n=1 Tax=Candidatus Methanomassiliicoccus intestinalis TaxID=1406512 RepID=UPI0037DD1B88|nr:MAG: hypothetical protein A3206_01635 [Candidatus Methanomassiliicoccus intestinalis]
MVKAIKLHITQQMPNYRKPASFMIKESYPLPPYSSIIGMVHAACGWTSEGSYHSMKISIQGTYASTVSDYATNYVFGIAYDPTRHQKKVDSGDGKYDGISVIPRSYELLTDVELIIHIVPEDAMDLNTIANSLINPPVYLSLGRYEDLAIISDVSIVDLEKCTEGILTHDEYIPDSYIDLDENTDLIGTVYRINKVFKITGSGKKKTRSWVETVRVHHACKGTLVTSENMYIDQSKDLVFLS